jgi:hypothetical protein
MALFFEAGIRIRYSVARMVRGSASLKGSSTLSISRFDSIKMARFDQNGKWIGSQKTRIRISQGPGENEFTGVAKVSILDLQDKEQSTSETQLEGKRIQVEAF